MSTAAVVAATAPARAQAPAGAVRRRLPLAGVLLLSLVVAALLRAFVAAPLTISSTSMSPTLERGDVVLVGRGPLGGGLDAGDLHRGDLVAFAAPGTGAQTLKRVVGLPGETVVVRDAVLYVDEQPVDEPYVDAEAVDASYSAMVTVPEDSVYVLGDNRGNSVDSRAFGAVPVRDLHGRVLVRLWPPVR